MKPIFIAVFSLMIFSACKKTNDNSKTDILSAPDIAATIGMTTELSIMQETESNLITATALSNQHHWDSIYHHHDSVFWHHHTNYHHESYFHDDHNHHWVQYDPTVDHHNHYHHTYPGHINDSLVTTGNNHHHTNSTSKTYYRIQ